MNDFKAYATRRLRRDQLASADERTWATHGSTRYLWDEARLAAAVAYTVDQQGAPLIPAPIDHRSNQSPER